MVGKYKLCQVINSWVCCITFLDLEMFMEFIIFFKLLLPFFKSTYSFSYQIFIHYFSYGRLQNCISLRPTKPASASDYNSFYSPNWWELFVCLAVAPGHAEWRCTCIASWEVELPRVGHAGLEATPVLNLSFLANWKYVQVWAEEMAQHLEALSCKAWGPGFIPQYSCKARCTMWHMWLELICSG